MFSTNVYIYIALNSATFIQVDYLATDVVNLSVY